MKTIITLATLLWLPTLLLTHEHTHEHNHLHEPGTHLPPLPQMPLPLY